MCLTASSQHPATKKYDLRHIKFVMSGAAPLSAELVERLVTILPNADITQGYGTPFPLFLPLSHQ